MIDSSIFMGNTQIFRLKGGKLDAPETLELVKILMLPLGNE